MSNKAIALTSRDKALLDEIRQYGLHSTKHLASRHFPGVQQSTVLRRLRMLEAANYIQRIPDLDGNGNAWGLSKAGAKFFVPSAAKVNFPRFIQEHDLKLSALRLRLENAGLAHSWRPEHEIRAKVAARCGREGTKDKNIPDGLMGVEVKGLKEAVAVELELTQKNQLRYGRIFHDYSSKQNLWGFWYVVGHPTIGKQLMTARNQFATPKQQPHFLWSLLEDVMADPLNAALNCREGSFRLREIWTPQLPSAAHAPAQGVGTQGNEAEAPVNELTHEYQMQI